MESRAKVLGHPIHPMLIVFPLGLLSTAVITDILYLALSDTRFPFVSFVLIAGGLLGGLLAAVFGLWDWLAIPSGTRAKSVGAAHGIGNVVVVGLFFVSWLIRWGTPDYVPTGLAFILGIVALVISLVTGWLGGELVDRLGVGVDPGAHLNAPNSLTGLPAEETARPEDVRASAR